MAIVPGKNSIIYTWRSRMSNSRQNSNGDALFLLRKHIRLFDFSSSFRTLSKNICTIPLLSVRIPHFPSFIFGLASLLPLSCEPLSVAPPPSEYDAPANVLAVVNSDSMQAGQSYRVQISFQNICGGTFTRNDRTTSGNQVTMQPIIHVVVQSGCPAIYTVQTVVDSVRFPASGAYQLLVHGLNEPFPKSVSVLSSFPPRDQYLLKFHFRTADTTHSSAYHVASFAFVNRSPTDPFEIMANANGDWDTTFVDTLPRVRYALAGIGFEAIRGVKEDGVILLP